MDQQASETLPAAQQDAELTPYQLKQALEWAINYLINIDNYHFIGPVLQCLTIKYSKQVPTLGIFYNKKSRVFEMLVNPKFFVTDHNNLQRVAFLKHEILHVLNAHVFFDSTRVGWNQMLTNVAMDLVINQTIKNLPEGGCFIENFRDKKGVAFRPNLPLEAYYEMLNDDAEVKMPNKNGDGSGGQGQGSDPSSGGSQGSGDTWVNAKDAFARPEAKGGDVHGWGDGSDVSQDELLKATADLIRRAKTKVSTTYSSGTPLDDLLEQIESKIRALDYRAILMSTLKKSLPAKFCRKTWKKHNRRYGDEAKGKIKAKLPRIELFADSSGSISTEELNEFLNIARNFLTVGVHSAHISFFHDTLYHRQKIKRDFVIEPSVVQSGGTNLQDCFDSIAKTKPDLAIFITDGYFPMPNLPKNLGNVVFVISQGGTVDHPLRTLGSTVKYQK